MVTKWLWLQSLTFLTPPTFLAQYPVRKASSTLTSLMSRLAVNRGITRSPVRTYPAPAINRGWTDLKGRGGA